MAAVPTTETEQPGMGKAIGGVVGTAVGVSSGAAAASLIVPGVGPVVGTGVLAMAILGLAGAVGGAAVGAKLEDSLAAGLPKDELFVYEDALRQGRSIVVVLAEGETEAEAARRVLMDAGAEDLDAARERWWIGVRDAEKERYEPEDNGTFAEQEQSYRRGFEAALRPELRGKHYDDAVGLLARGDERALREPSFRRGYERGRAYYQERRKDQAP